MKKIFPLTFVLLSVLPVSEARSQEPADDPAAFAATVTAAWRQRRQSIKSVTCATELDTFFSKECLSDGVPPQDKEINGEPVNYVIDLVMGRCIKHSKVTSPLRKDDQFTLAREEINHVYDGNIYRLFRIKDPAKVVKDSKYDDVVMYEDGVHSFFFNGRDMPLFWSFGSVNNDQPMPARLLTEIPLDRLKVGDEVDVRGKKCRALTTREQESPTAVREFLVDVAPPYLIRQCSCRDGTKQIWKIEVFHRGDTQESLSHWTVANYFGGIRYTHRVKELIFNAPFDAKMFDTALAAGQKVFNTLDSQHYQVGEDQTLLPDTGEPLPKGRWWWRVGLVVAILIALFVPILIVRSRKRRHEGT